MPHRRTLEGLSRPGLRLQGWRRLPAGSKIAVVILALIAAMAILAPVVAPYDPGDTGLAKTERTVHVEGIGDTVISDTAVPPSAQHLFGTDKPSRDIFSRAVYGARVSLVRRQDELARVDGLVIPGDERRLQTPALQERHHPLGRHQRVVLGQSHALANIPLQLGQLGQPVVVRERTARGRVGLIQELVPEVLDALDHHPLEQLGRAAVRRILSGEHEAVGRALDQAARLPGVRIHERLGLRMSSLAVARVCSESPPPPEPTPTIRFSSSNLRSGSEFSKKSIIS